MYPNLRARKKSICWIGLLTETILIANLTLVSADPLQRPSFPSRLNPNVNPTEALADPSHRMPADLSGQARNAPSPYFDDEEDDGQDDDFFARPTHPSAANPTGANQRAGNPQRSAGAGAVSAGGMPHSEGSDPIRTSRGISIGGQPANGVISSNLVPTLKIDDESAEGSKEMVTDFNFPDADILDLAKTLGKLTGKNFVLDKEIKGKVSIITNSPITVSQAWKLFLTALDVNGLALVPSGAYLRIAKQRDARDKQIKTYTGDSSPDTDALITRVFSLKYISAEEVARTFRNIVPATSRIIPYEQTNTVIVTDTGSNISRLAKLLELLDVEGFDAGIEVIPVKFASAAELSKLIDTLIPGTAAGTGGGSGGPGGMPRLGGGRFNARRTKEGGIINTIIADERTNTLIVHANVKGTDQVRELVAKLDLKVPTSLGGGKVRVVYLSFADAEQVANTLNNFSTQTRGPSGMSGGAGGTGSNPIAGSLFEGSIKISADKATNSLVITASPSDFVTVQRVINQLDIQRDQVYVEVVLMEVSMNRGLNFSANAAAPNSFLASTPGGGKDLSFLNNGILGILGNTGGLITLPLGPSTNFNSGGQTLNNVPSAFAMIKASQDNQHMSVLATPQIIALDNTEATFESTEKIPTQSASAVQGSALTVTPGAPNNVTTSIKIKPQINKIINFVKMDITVKLSDIDNSNVPLQLQNIAVGTTERNAQTTVLVGDSDTVALGGLVRDRSSEQTTKIPLLGDIPILGWLFKAKSTKVEKRNLVILMTPHIVRQYEKVRAILDKKLKERDEFLETNTGGVDPLRYERDRIIRSLPDPQELKHKRPQTTDGLDDEKPVTQPAAKEIAPVSAVSPASENERAQTQPHSAGTSPKGTATPVVPTQAADVKPSGESKSEQMSPAPVAAPAPTPTSAPAVNSSGITPTPMEPMKPVPAPPPEAPVGRN